MSEPTRALPRGALRTAALIAFAGFMWFVLTGGGRIVGSDEVTMLELSRSMMSGRIDVPAGATLQGRDGLHYTKNAPGQAILALPLVVAGEIATRAAGFDAERRVLALRFVVSFFNAGVTAVLLGVFYLFVRWLGVSAAVAMGTTLMLGLTTPVWVYAKSFMAEPLQSLGVLLAVWGALRARNGSGFPWMAGVGFLLAVIVKPSMGPLALMALAPLWTRDRGGFLITALIGLVSIALFALYNLARFGSPFESGYGSQATLAGYTTPLWVGLYGLLLSSGKGVLWFAPTLWLAPAGAGAMRRAGGTRRALFHTLLMVTAVALLLYGTFQHWAGDGSFGPRYLLPLLPLWFLLVAVAMEGASRARRRVMRLLVVAGFLVQFGGVAIHFGAQMREAGDYPYTTPLSDPRFMSDSHFNPAFTPILGHWRMLIRNVGEHAAGRMPRLQGGGAADERLVISREDQQRLLHAIDFWWFYTLYAGIPLLPVSIAYFVLTVIMLLALRALRRAHEDEAVAG